MLNKIKSFLKVLVSLFNPAKAKQYLVGYSVGKTVGFSFLAITLFWVVFMASSLLLPYSILSNKDFTTKVHTKVMEAYDIVKTAVINTVEHMPDFVIFIQAIEKNESMPLVRFKMLTPDEPFSIIFLIDPDTCKFKDIANMKYKLFSNVLFSICSHSKASTLKEYLKSVRNPVFMLTFNTDAQSFFKKNYPVEFEYYRRMYESSLKQMSVDLIDSLYIKSVFRMDVTDKKVSFSSSDQEINGRLRGNEFLFTNIFTVKDPDSGKTVLIDSQILNIPIPKSAVLSAFKLWFNSFSSQLDRTLFQLLSTRIITAFMNVYLSISIVLLPVLVLISFITFTPKAYVLFFGLPGVAVILTLVGLILSKIFRGTSSKFDENLKLALGAALAIFLYRLIIYIAILLGLIVGVSPVSSAVWHILGIVLFEPGIAFLVALLYMVALKYLAYKELQVAGMQ